VLHPTPNWILEKKRGLGEETGETGDGTVILSRRGSGGERKGMGGRHPPCRAEVPSNFSAAVAPMLVGGLGAGLTVTVSFTSPATEPDRVVHGLG